jgi:hypothetical protein
LRGGGYVGASDAAMVGASAAEALGPVALFPSGLPHCEQNGASRSNSEPHFSQFCIGQAWECSVDIVQRLALG